MNTDQKTISFVPTHLLKNISKGVREERFPTIVAFADVSGFTAMSEKLSAMGNEGAETLTSILNSYFTTMISIIHHADGFVGKFGGDAMTVFFPIKDPSKRTYRVQNAVRTMLDLQDRMVDFQAMKTRGGTFSLGMKIGMALGDTLFQVVGCENDIGREIVLAGNPLDGAADAEHHGVSGEVIITSDIAKSCKILGEEIEDGFFRISPDFKPARKAPKKRKAKLVPKWTEIAKTFIDPAVNHRIALGMDSVGEIRRVSVIFISFSGLDYDNDEKVGEKLTELYAWIYGVTTKYDGSINKIDMGDKGSKLILTFGTPTAHENDEELAIYCGLELVGGLDRMKELGISLKMGIATGSVFAGEVGSPERQEYTIMGSVVNLSARIMSNSLKGQLLTDSVTYERVKDVFDFAEPKFVQFKGISEPMPVYRARGLKGESTKKREVQKLPLVGRKKEVSSALKVIEKVKKGKSQVLIIRGDTGTGKSRLSEELVDVISESDFRVAGGEALSYAIKSPYFIWISTLRRLMGLPGSGGGQKVLDQLQKVVEEADPENTFRLPIVANLLGVKCEDNELTKHFDGQLRQENLFDFVVQYLKFLSDKSPVSILIEDAQWIDTNSLALMTYILRNLADSPVLFIYVRRPYNKDFKTPYIGAIEGHEATTAITVDELTRKNTEKLIIQKYKASRIDDELMKFLYDSSHGNASFVEQLFDKLLSTKVIKFTLDSDGTGVFIDKEGDLSEVEVPDSLNSLIMSKLDSLDPQSKLTVNVAAAIGRQFQVDIVKGSYPTDLDDELIIESMDELDSREILIQSGEEDIYDYIFKNLLTQEVAYNSLLFSHRREYHKKIGYCLETMYGDSLIDWYDELARHYSQTDEDGKAITYLHKAGDKAFDIYANEYALSCYSKAIKRASSEERPDERFRLLNMREKVFTFLGQMEARKKDLDELLELGYERSDKKGTVSVLFNLSGYYQRTHELDAMKKVIDEANEILKTIDFPFGQININSSAGDWFYLQNKVKEALEKWTISESESERIGDDKGLSAILIRIGVAQKALGNYDKAFESYYKSVEIGRKIGNKKFEAINLGNIGVLHHIRGDLDKALEAYTQALEIAKSIGSKQTQTLYLGNVATIYKKKGERDRALRSYEELLALTVKMGYHRGTILALSNVGLWYQDNGDFENAFKHYDEALKISEKFGFKDQITRIKINQGLVFHYQMKLEKSAKILDQAVESSIEVNSKPMEDYARRYLGYVYLDLNKFREADEQFKQAFEIAEAMGSKTSCASCKIGFGLIEMIEGKGRKNLDEGITESRKIGDAEVIIKGLIGLAKHLMKNKSTRKEALETLKDARNVAQTGGYLCDLVIIDPLIKQLQG